MKCKIASFFTVVLIIGVYLLFATISYAANEEVDPLFNEFLRDHPYEYAGLIDLDEDGRDEMLVASTHFEFDWHNGFENVSLLVSSGGKVSVYPMRSYYSTIAFDPINRCLVGDTGGTGAYAYNLLTVDSGSVYEWMVGYERGFTPDNDDYQDLKRILYCIPSNEDGMRGLVCISREPIDENEFQDYRDWFDSLMPVSLSPSSDIERIVPDDTDKKPVRLPPLMPLLSAGGQHTLMLRKDGTVAAVGGNDDGQMNINPWENMVKICAGIQNSVGLREDGTVLATGNNQFGQCDVGGWNGIADISTQHYHTLGLRDDMTVVATGFNEWGECSIDDWTGIVQVSAGQYHSVGLDYYGRVLATGRNQYGQCDVSEWFGITSVEAGYNHTVGLTFQGRVVATGRNNRGQCNVSGWENVRQISAGGEHTVALLTDGTVIAVGNNDFGQCNVSDWHNIVRISAGYNHTVGIMSDGTIVATGWAEKGQCDIGRLR